MNIIFLGKRHGRSWTIKLKPHWMFSSVLAVVLVSMAAGASALYATRSYWMGENVVANAGDQRQEIQMLRAMTDRMTEIQARMMRIDALGAHLAEGANLKGDEFDFSKAPPMGGPDLIDDTQFTEYQLAPVESSDVQQQMSQLWDSVQTREAQLRALDHILRKLRNNKVDLSNMPVRDGYITSGFGYRTDPLPVSAKCMRALISLAARVPMCTPLPMVW